MEPRRENNLLDKIFQYSKKPLLILFIITLGISIYLLSVQSKIGVPYWDVFNYLNNALYFSGLGSENLTNGLIYLPPLIPILTSVLFRIGYVSINAIFIISTFMFIIGIIGFYLLLKERFNSIVSFTGAIILISLPVMMSWAVSGGIDISGVALSIWTMYFLIIGLKKDSKYLFLVLPIFALAFISRYTAGLIIIPLLFYLLINIQSIKNIKNLKITITGIFIEFIALFGITAYLLVKLNISSSVLTLLMGAITSSSSGVGDFSYDPNVFYYGQNLLNYISIAPISGSYQQILNPAQAWPSIFAYAIALIILIGLFFYVYNGYKSKISNKNQILSKRSNVIKIVFILVLISAGVVSFYYKSFITSELILFVTLYILYRFIIKKDPRKLDNLQLDFMFLAWFGAYFIFQSILPYKVDRYFITMTPPFVFFITLGLHEFVKLISPKIKNINLRRYGIYLLISLIFISIGTATYMGHTPKKTFTVDIGDSSQWIMDNDPNYYNKVISSDYPNAATWFFKKEVLGLYPLFSHNSSEFADSLRTNNVDYYIDSINKTHPDFNGYTLVKSFGVVAIYKRSDN